MVKQEFALLKALDLGVVFMSKSKLTGRDRLCQLVDINGADIIVSKQSKQPKQVLVEWASSLSKAFIQNIILLTLMMNVIKFSLSTYCTKSVAQLLCLVSITVLTSLIRVYKEGMLRIFLIIC